MAPDPIWAAGTWEGNRSLQRRAFQALTFREKLQAIEEMSEIAALFARTSDPEEPQRAPRRRGDSQDFED